MDQAFRERVVSAAKSEEDKKLVNTLFDITATMTNAVANIPQEDLQRAKEILLKHEQEKLIPLSEHVLRLGEFTPGQRVSIRLMAQLWCAK